MGSGVKKESGECGTRLLLKEGSFILRMRTTSCLRKRCFFLVHHAADNKITKPKQLTAGSNSANSSLVIFQVSS